MPHLVQHTSGARIVVEKLDDVDDIAEAAPSPGKFVILSRFILDYDGDYVWAVLADIEREAVLDELRRVDPSELVHYDVDEDELKSDAEPDNITLSNMCVLLFDMLRFDRASKGVTVDQKGMHFMLQHDTTGLCKIDPAWDQVYGLFAYVHADNHVVLQHST
jgi:hypothetical protein